MDWSLVLKGALIAMQVAPTKGNKKRGEYEKIKSERDLSVFNYGVPLSIISNKIEHNEQFKSVDIFSTDYVKPHINDILIENNIEMDNSSSRVLLSEYVDERHYFSGTLISIEIAENVNQVQVVLRDVIVGNKLGSEQSEGRLLYYDHINLFCDKNKISSLRKYLNKRMKVLGTVKMYTRLRNNDLEKTKSSTSFDDVEIL